MTHIESTLSRDKILVVDEQDNVISVQDKLFVHQKGLLHRAFSVMLYRYHNGVLEFLLQQRASTKYHCGGLWTNTCCSHPGLDDQSVSASALERLKEELMDININKLELVKVGQFIYRAEFSNGLIEHELDHVFIGHYDQLPEFFNPAEISKLQWMPAVKIYSEYHRDKDLYTPWFYRVYSMCCNKLNTD